MEREGKPRFLTAKQATEILGVNAGTLYAYVSRGLIRSEGVAGDSRSRRYNAEDVEKLRSRKELRKNPARVAQDALHWGTPLLESALTLITDDALYYRGYNVLTLATTHSIEQVAALLWTGNTDDVSLLFGKPPNIDNMMRDLRGLPGNFSLLQLLQLALTLASRADLAAYDLTSENVALTGARILYSMAAALSNDILSPSIGQMLCQGWTQGHAQCAPWLNEALILCADHELNVSSFAARVVASAEANPYSVVTAGLAAMSGILHGGAAERAEALLEEIVEHGTTTDVVSGRLQRGERIPGFGQPLYPQGDPRGRLLLNQLTEAYPKEPAVIVANRLIATVRHYVALEPNLDFSLAVLSRTLHLPYGASVAIFALGRTVGWIGHAIEQYSQGTLIRPRAHYTGVPIRTEP